MLLCSVLAKAEKVQFQSFLDKCGYCGAGLILYVTDMKGPCFIPATF